MIATECTITTITTQLDALTRSLVDVPSRCPEDAQIGANLLAYVVADLHCGQPIRLILNTMERRGVDRAEALALAASLKALALALAAQLGRSQTCP